MSEHRLLNSSIRKLNSALYVLSKLDPKSYVGPLFKYSSENNFWQLHYKAKMMRGGEPQRLEQNKNPKEIKTEEISYFTYLRQLITTEIMFLSIY